MPSPFPGMDPYLEGYLWPDLHHRLATQIANLLTAQIAPRYVARIVVRTVLEVIDTGEEIGVMLPDVELSATQRARGRISPHPSPDMETISPVTATLVQPLMVEAEIPSVEIREVAGGLLVTSIEILSPTNKYGVNWEEYQRKRQRVIRAQAHLLEIDLIRRGRHPISVAGAPRAPYWIFLTRAQTPTNTDTWAVQLRESLPTVPVPLHPPDQDVSLNLQRTLATIYDQARYDLSLDYTKPPEYPLPGEDGRWARQLLDQYSQDDSPSINGMASS